MEKYSKKRKRLCEMSTRHLRRLVQNEMNLLDHNDQDERSSEIHTLSNISTSAKMFNAIEHTNECDNHIEFICSETGNDNVNIIHESNEIKNNTENNAVYLANLNIVENVEEERCFKSLLCDWAVTNNVNHVALTRLLKILRTHECFSNLPVDPRTLLHTPK